MSIHFCLDSTGNSGSTLYGYQCPQPIGARGIQWLSSTFDPHPNPQHDRYNHNHNYYYQQRMVSTFGSEPQRLQASAKFQPCKSNLIIDLDWDSSNLASNASYTSSSTSTSTSSQPCDTTQRCYVRNWTMPYTGMTTTQASSTYGLGTTGSCTTS